MFPIAICRQSGDKRRSKTLFLTIIDIRSSTILTFSIAAYPVCTRSYKSSPDCIANQDRHRLLIHLRLCSSKRHFNFPFKDNSVRISFIYINYKFNWFSQSIILNISSHALALKANLFVLKKKT